MILDSIHLAPNAPWIALGVVSLGLVVLAVWAYRFGVPPLPVLAQRVLERARAGGGSHVTVLVDSSRSMELPESADAPKRRTRSAAAQAAVEELRRALRGRTAVSVVPFAGALGV